MAMTILTTLCAAAAAASALATPQYQIGLDAATVANVRANLLSSANARYVTGALLPLCVAVGSPWL
jgi:hypothetical protein